LPRRSGVYEKLHAITEKFRVIGSIIMSVCV
jgi:hypothetical protein